MGLVAESVLRNLSIKGHSSWFSSIKHIFQIFHWMQKLFHPETSKRTACLKLVRILKFTLSKLVYKCLQNTDCPPVLGVGLPLVTSDVISPELVQRHFAARAPFFPQKKSECHKMYSNKENPWKFVKIHENPFSSSKNKKTLTTPFCWLPQVNLWELLTEMIDQSAGSRILELVPICHVMGRIGFCWKSLHYVCQIWQQFTNSHGFGSHV